MIRIGTSGWSYDDWRGAWYPPELPRSKMLGFYAGVFGAVEINATYYAVPGRRSAEGMVRTAAGRLRFAVKAPGDFTHKGDLSEALLAAWNGFLDPFREARCLGAVLMQFPQRFHRTPGNAEYLRRLCGSMREAPLVAEFRHESWDAREADGLLHEAGVSRAVVDQPELRGLSASGARRAAGALGYVRFHGRNAAAWHSNENSHDRYRYAYREEELREWIPAVEELDREATSTYLFFNNHPEGNAPRDAERMASMLGVTLRGTGYRDLFSA